MYSVRILRRALKDIAALPSGYTKLVGEHIDRLAQEPRPRDAKKLKGTFDYSLRVGVYRILTRIKTGPMMTKRRMYSMHHLLDEFTINGWKKRLVQPYPNDERPCLTTEEPA